MRHLAFSVLSLLLLNFHHHAFVHSKVVTWLPSGGGDLSDSGNWQGGNVPGQDDDVRIYIKSSGADDGVSIVSLSDGHKLSVHSLDVSGLVALNIESPLSAVTTIQL